MADETGSDTAVGRTFDGSALAAARTRRGLSQVELAALVGYEGVATISKLEKGARKPSPRKWIQLADALGVEPDELARPVDPEGPPPVHDLPESAAAPKASGVSRHVALLEAAKQAKQNQARVQAITTAVDELDRATVWYLDRWSATQARLHEDVLAPFFDATRRIEGIEGVGDLPDLGDADPSTLSMQQRLQIQHTSLQAKMIDFAGTTAAGAGAGALAGAGAAYAAYAATAAWATASTGAAISGLSGAAATSATLAALGGGSLAAGGLGVAGGTAVLTGIIAAPVLIAAGVAGVYMGRKMRAKTRSESARIAEAERELRANQTKLQVLWTWLDRADVVLERAASEGQDLIDELQIALRDSAARHATTSPASAGATRWGSLTGHQQRTYHDLASLIATIVNVLTAPFLAILDEALPRDDVAEIRAWNDLVLADAEATILVT